MPFFSAGLFYKYYTPKNSLKRTPFVKFTESLQVPSNFPLIYRKRQEKRVLPFTSNSYPASLTIEAAFSLSLFLLMASAVLQPILWLDRQRKVQTAVEVFCGELSQYAYIERFLAGDQEICEALEEEDYTQGSGSLSTGFLKEGFFSEAAASLWLLGKIGETDIDMASVRIKKAEVPDSAADICFELEYAEKVPFFPVPSGKIIMHAAVKRRSWIGLNGKLKGNGEDGENNREPEDEMVYVGANMGRYHWFRDCHYISNQYKSIPSNQAGSERNSFGKKYTACSSCARKGSSSGQVYITSGGEHYHTTPDCKAMISYVRQVPLKEVEYLGSCSYCSRRKEE